jgi:hypothetical protein
MESQQNICPSCNKVNILSSNICIECSHSLTAIHENNDIIEEFINVTNSDRENAIQLLGISNSINDAVALFFETSSSMNTNNLINNIELTENTIFNEMISLLTNTNQDNSSQINRDRIYNILNNLNDNPSERVFDYPGNNKELTTQMLYGWGTNSPHHCNRCSARAFIKYIKVKNMDKTQMISLIPPEIVIRLKLDTSEKRLQCSEDILNNIDQFWQKICNVLSDSFNIIYSKYNDFKNKYSDIYGEQLTNNFLEVLQHNISINYRIIWHALHQQDINTVIPPEERYQKLIELSNSETFIQYVTNEWNSKIHNTPVTKETIECLRHEKINSDEKLKELKLENENCAICFDNFKSDNTEITLLGCHSFCKECILPWFKENDTCPICRKKIDYTEKKNLKTE